MSARNLKREQRFLTEAARGHDPFVRHATARLEAGEEPFGDSWCWIGVRKHLAELLEEAADLGSWAALCDQTADHDPRLSDVDRERVRAVLALVARLGAQAHEALDGVSCVLSSAEGGVTGSRLAPAHIERVLDPAPRPEPESSAEPGRC